MLPSPTLPTSGSETVRSYASNSSLLPTFSTQTAYILVLYFDVFNTEIEVLIYRRCQLLEL